jgi:hypothetical protein
LVGFDLDLDVLDAGAEVIGALYWRTVEGPIRVQRFRQPDLWPNSGNSWLPLQGFSTCLPGYVESPWVPACASDVTWRDDGRNPAGYLRSPMTLHGDIYPDALPDANLTTASVPLHEGERVVYGGWWQVIGTFPSPHVARSNIAGTNGYELVLDLSTAAKGSWHSKADVASQAQGNYEYIGWLRPRSGKGEGVLELDDVFSFVLPDGLR